MSDFDTSTTISPLDNPFWQFSLKVYKANQIQEICHSLQDKEGANVNLLLYCFWLAYEKEAMPEEAFNLACQTIMPWHEQITANLRKARRSIEIAGEETGWLKDFFKRVLMDEILSESCQQLLLYKASGKSKSVFNMDEELAYRYLTWLFKSMGVALDEARKKELQELVTRVRNSLEEKVS